MRIMGVTVPPLEGGHKNGVLRLDLDFFDCVPAWWFELCAVDIAYLYGYNKGPARHETLHHRDFLFYYRANYIGTRD